MPYRHEERCSDAVPRCPECDDVIGVYEPLVHTLGALARRTSRAVEPGVFAADGECYHLDCYERLVGRS